MKTDHLAIFAQIALITPPQSSIHANYGGTFGILIELIDRTYQSRVVTKKVTLGDAKLF